MCLPIGFDSLHVGQYSVIPTLFPTKNQHCACRFDLLICPMLQSIDAFDFALAPLSVSLND
ncbi:MAG: hypothetical protein LBS65_01155, partial [Desulfovibrio sp.]|nr:hypothetical protein [Desulfovibrio sp.]